MVRRGVDNQQPLPDQLLYLLFFCGHHVFKFELLLPYNVVSLFN